MIGTSIFVVAFCIAVGAFVFSVHRAAIKSLGGSYAPLTVVVLLDCMLIGAVLMFLGI